MTNCESHHFPCRCTEELFKQLLAAVKLGEATLIKLPTSTDNDKAIKAGALRVLGQAILDATRHFPPKPEKREEPTK